MKGSIKLFKVSDISINVHVTFFLLLFIAMAGGIKGVVFILGVFCFVTLHELCHSLVAQKLGIRVKEITLLPIGGVASLTRMPEKPSEEFLISIVGPLFNIAVILIFYLPLQAIVGRDILFSFFQHGASFRTWAHVFVYIYWVNLILAIFNLIPAFPMDGGRILRSILAQRLGYQKATRIAVNFGHIFALLFLWWGITPPIKPILLIIAVFVYMAASSEELQVNVRETLRKFRIKDIVPSEFRTLEPETTLAKVLELIFHSHQEDFPIIEAGKLIGFVTRNDIINGIHQHGTSVSVSLIMRKKFPVLQESDPLNKAQNIMQENEIKALPVVRSGNVIGVVTIEDITRVYSVMSKR